MPLVKPALREIVGSSYIAAVAIAVLLLWTIESVARAVGPLLVFVVDFFSRALAIRGIPTYSEGYWLILVFTLGYFLNAVFSLIAAWILSRWVYKASPFSSLSQCRARFERRNHV
jgi:hypothetical protein